jgi:hypothetical protein
MAAYAIQFRRGTTTEHSSFTGLAGEVTVDTTKNTVVVHDGSTSGGYALALEGAAVSTSTGAFSSNVTIGGNLTVTGTTTGDVTGNLTGNVTGNVTGDVTGDLTGDSTGTHTGAVVGTTGSFSGDVTMAGNLTISGTTTTVNSTNVEIGDNIIALNADVTGAPTENAGIDVERGTSTNVQLLWNETDDKWTVGSETFVAATFEGALTGNVTGNVTGDLTGDVTGNVTGNVSGSAGTVTSIAGHVLDSDTMTGATATNVPSAESVKTYVDSQVAGKDHLSELSGTTDDVSEGSTNQYHTTARARAAISASGSLSYDNSTGVMSFTMNDETVQDIVGAMVVGGTNVTATYDDAANTLTLASTDTTYSVQDGQLSQNNFTDADHSKLDGIEATADVTDATNVAAAGAVMESDSTTAAMSFVIDEDNMASDSATKVPTQQSVKAYTDARETAITSAYQSYADQAEVDAKAYADTEIAALVDSSPAAMDTLNELAAALGDDANFSTTVTNSIATKLALAGGTMSGNIAMGGNDITGGGDATFTNFNGTATYAKYADLAERYAADATYEEGTVMAFGGEAEVTSAEGYGSTKIAGVVSTKPAFAMNDAAGNSETHPFIALQGRVPCKVVGTVSKGDILVASDISGTATVWTESTVDPRMTAYVGIAIEDKTTDGEGYVEVKVGK